MSAGFGFSVGDFISGIQLVRNLIKALKDSAGSSKEYLELIAELWSLESALVQVKAAYGEVQAPAQRVALGQAVQACQQCIDDFLKSISKYHHHLNIHGTKSTIRDGFRKIQWHLTKPKEIGAFHTSIAAHVSSIQTLLVTIQVSSMGLTRRHEKNQITQMGDINNSLILINTSFDDLRKRLVDQGSISKQTLANFDAVKQMMIADKVQLLGAIKQLQDAIPPQVLLQKPVIFLDALNRVAPIHLDWIDSWDAFLAVLEVRFKSLGHSKVKRREFTLQETTTRRAIILSRPIGMCLTPGQHLAMSMVFRDLTGGESTNMCPHCHEPCDGAATEDIECLHCGCHFRRIEEQDAAPRIQEQDAASRVTKKRKREFVSQAQLHDDDDVQPSDFKRLHLTYNVARSRGITKPRPRAPRLPIARDEQSRRTGWGEPPDSGLTSTQSGNHTLPDYQMQLMLLEQQNKRRLLKARQEQDELSRLPGIQSVPTGWSETPDSGLISAQSGNHMLQDYQMQLMLLEQQKRKRIIMARQEQESFIASAASPSMGDPQNRGSPILFMSNKDANFNKAFSSPANTNVTESTPGVLKEPSLAKEAKQRYSPILRPQEVFDRLENLQASPFLHPESDPSADYGTGAFSLHSQPSPAHSPYISPRLFPQADTSSAYYGLGVSLPNPSTEHFTYPPQSAQTLRAVDMRSIPSAGGGADNASYVSNMSNGEASPGVLYGNDDDFVDAIKMYKNGGNRTDSRWMDQYLPTSVGYHPTEAYTKALQDVFPDQMV